MHVYTPQTSRYCTWVCWCRLVRCLPGRYLPILLSPLHCAVSFLLLSPLHCDHACASSAAQHKALKRSLDCGGGCEGVRVTGEDMSCALKEVRPSAMREVAVEVPKVHQTGEGLYNVLCSSS